MDNFTNKQSIYERSFQVDTYNNRVRRIHLLFQYFIKQNDTKSV